MSQLRIESLCFQSRGPISLTIAPSECVCLSGVSGSGKTLLLRALADLDPHDGEAFLDEIACSEFSAPQWRQQVAMLPAESHWWFDRVGDHFSSPPEGSLAKLGFTAAVMAWQISRLSTGERHRLALLRMLSRSPKALLLDEPTANLDGDNTSRVETLIGDYRQSNATPVLWVSHDPAQIRRVADRWFLIADGQIHEKAIER